MMKHDIDVVDAQPIRQHSGEDHLVRIKKLFKRLSEGCLTVNLTKCEFAKATVTYLGKLVGQGKVRPVQAKVSATV